MPEAFSIDRPLFKSGSTKAYLVTGVIVAIATLLRALLGSWADIFPYMVFFPGVVVATVLCGTRAGLLALLLSVLSSWVFFRHLDFRTVQFAIGSLAVITVTAVLRRANDQVLALNETLRISERKFRGLIDSAPDAMVILDATGRIALINSRTEQLFGYARAELIGQPADMLLRERDRAGYEAQLAVVRNGAQPDAKMVPDIHGLTKTRKTFPLEISFGLLATRTGPLISSTLRDITERRHIEASLADASKAKSEFLARVSHELRTPLNAIIGFSELIRDGIGAPLDERYKEYGADINNAGRHLLNIVNDILDISKIEDGRLELREEIVSIAESLEACRRFIAVMAEKAEVALSIEVPEAMPYLRSDQIRLRQILLNVMSNAVKFTPPGGRVSIRAEAGPEGAQIAVQDTGIGMRPEDIAVALEPFRQIESTLSRRFEGTGLGLPLTKALIELHGGQLHIESEPTKGTLVRIGFPPERVIPAAA